MTTLSSAAPARALGAQLHRRQALERAHDRVRVESGEDPATSTTWYLRQSGAPQREVMRHARPGLPRDLQAKAQCRHWLVIPAEGFKRFYRERQPGDLMRLRAG
jgi:hypothetical protein